MGRPHPMELRRRVVDFVEEGHSHREAARHFRVSIRFVNDMVRPSGRPARSRSGRREGAATAGSPGRRNGSANAWRGSRTRPWTG